jgi:hypothetical protein
MDLSAPFEETLEQLNVTLAAKVDPAPYDPALRQAGIIFPF